MTNEEVLPKVQSIIADQLDKKPQVTPAGVRTVTAAI